MSGQRPPSSSETYWEFHQQAVAVIAHDYPATPHQFQQTGYGGSQQTMNYWPSSAPHCQPPYAAPCPWNGHIHTLSGHHQPRLPAPNSTGASGQRPPGSSEAYGELHQQADGVTAYDCPAMHHHYDAVQRPLNYGPAFVPYHQSSDAAPYPPVPYYNPPSILTGTRPTHGNSHYAPVSGHSGTIGLPYMAQRPSAPPAMYTSVSGGDTTSTNRLTEVEQSLKSAGKLVGISQFLMGCINHPTRVKVVDELVVDVAIYAVDLRKNILEKSERLVLNMVTALEYYLNLSLEDFKKHRLVIIGEMERFHKSAEEVVEAHIKASNTVTEFQRRAESMTQGVTDYCEEQKAAARKHNKWAKMHDEAGWSFTMFLPAAVVADIFGGMGIASAIGATSAAIIKKISEKNAAGRRRKAAHALDSANEAAHALQVLQVDLADCLCQLGDNLTVCAQFFNWLKLELERSHGGFTGPAFEVHFLTMKDGASDAIRACRSYINVVYNVKRELQMIHTVLPYNGGGCARAVLCN